MPGARSRGTIVGRAALRPNEIEIRMLVDQGRLSAIRALASDLAIRADFDLDTVDDLRLALEELLAAVVTNADPNAVLVCRLLITRSRVEAAASVALRAALRPTVSRLSLRILRTLSDSVDFWITTGHGERLFHGQLARSLA